jgi:hypothetical protein
MPAEPPRWSLPDQGLDHMTVELLLRLIDLVQVALDRFGSGWVWLYYSLKSQMLVVDSTPNQVGAYGANGLGSSCAYRAMV